MTFHKLCAADRRRKAASTRIALDKFIVRGKNNPKVHEFIYNNIDRDGCNFVQRQEVLIATNLRMAKWHESKAL